MCVKHSILIENYKLINVKERLFFHKHFLLFWLKLSYPNSNQWYNCLKKTFIYICLSIWKSQDQNMFVQSLHAVQMH